MKPNLSIPSKILFALRRINAPAKKSTIIALIRTFEPTFEKRCSSALTYLTKQEIICSVNLTGSMKDVYYSIKKP